MTVVLLSLVTGGKEVRAALRSQEQASSSPFAGGTACVWNRWARRPICIVYVDHIGSQVRYTSCAVICISARMQAAQSQDNICRSELDSLDSRSRRRARATSTLHSPAPSREIAPQQSRPSPSISQTTRCVGGKEVTNGAAHEGWSLDLGTHGV